MHINIIGEKSKTALNSLNLNKDKKNYALNLISEYLKENYELIIKSNNIDIENAKNNGMSPSMIDRLMLDKSRIYAMADGVLQIAKDTDPTGIVLDGKRLSSGINMQKITVPLGVIGIIYESRPNVTSDCAALCLKAGNCVILKGGKEAINSNKAIADIMRNALNDSGLDQNCVQLIEDTSRESTMKLMTMNEFVDVLIPRGSASLINAVVKNATVPVIETGTGNCHVYIDEFADFDKAVNIIHNAKCSRPSVCNATETLLVHEKIAEQILPKIQEKLSGVKLLGCEKTMSILSGIELATEEDFYKEFLDYILSIKIVKNTVEATEHIAKYSSRHSEAIVTENYSNSEYFINAVDSAAVYVNASTRFTDGGEFGFGAEIGISTQKLHARGPMGLAELVSYKYVLRGDGQIR